MATKYLYGAAVQGIQSFIFQTNKLKEIVGASELVEEVCTEVFEDAIKKKCDKDNPNAIINASGHIKYIFTDKQECADLVKDFPKLVQEHAPGITFSQAVVKMTDDYNKDVEELETLLKIQRNRPMRSQTLGLMGILRSRQTGLPVTKHKKVKGKMEYLDAAANAKLFVPADSDNEREGEKIRNKTIPDEEDKNKTKEQIRPLLRDLDKKGGNNDWIAVIHIDGNGLGYVVEKVCEQGAKVFKKFSSDLDNAVKQSAKAAFRAVKHYFPKDENKKGKDDPIPIRPLILSGEDYNLICRADFAVEYVKAFLATFEDKTSFLKEYHLKLKGEDKEIANLTACAGIAFVKSSFPFYYAYDLANGLCDFAKKQSERKASCLMFHKVQDSFTESYDEIVKRDLTPRDGHSWQFGPYYLDKNIKDRWSIDYLLDCTRILNAEYDKNNDSYIKLFEKTTILTKDCNAIKSHIRQWMSLLSENEDVANEKERRIISVHPKWKKYIQLFLDKDITPLKKRKDKDGNPIYVYPVYDVLSLFTMMYQTIKQDGND